MADIPDDARWHLADVVLEFRVADDPGNLVHINTHLVEAASPDEAYIKAMALGRASEHGYENMEGKWVDVVFRGLCQLLVIHEPLEDGAELMYSSHEDVTEARFRAWIVPREELEVFAPRPAPEPKDRQIMPTEFGWALEDCPEDAGDSPTGPRDD